MIAFLLLPLVLALPHVAPSDEGPPGLKLIKGGHTKIGSSIDQIEKIVLSSEQNGGFRHIYIGEIPQHRVTVEDFYLGINEVTVEQYAVFLRATGHKPPIYFADDAVKGAIAAFNEEQRVKAEEAKLAGERYQRQKFDADAWWADNWHEAHWEVPSKAAKSPVVFVDFSDVEAYCTWAGVRPMTEFEFQRAARENTDRNYPWGDDWDDKLAGSVASGSALPFEVGNFPGGAVDGIYDLSGNVWEWTSSSYDPYPGYKPQTFKKGKGRSALDLRCEAPFDAAKRVGVSGSVGSGADVLRVSVRQGMIRAQSANQLGFRLASSKTPGLDLAENLWKNQLKQPFLGDLEPFLLQPTILQKWTSEPGTVELEGYSMITGHDAIMFVPVLKLGQSSPNELKKASEEEGPMPLGFLHTTVELTQPPLSPGSYYLAWRAAGEVVLPEAEPEPNGEGEQALLSRSIGAQQDGASWWDVPGFDAKQNQLFVYDRKGTPLLAVDSNEPGKEKLKSGVTSVLRYEAYTPPKKVDEDAPPPPVLDNVFLKMIVAPRTTTNGMVFRFDMKVAPKTVDATWK